eukprot:11707208-Karenia_brevis.AAC.1
MKRARQQSDLRATGLAIKPACKMQGLRQRVWQQSAAKLWARQQRLLMWARQRARQQSFL